MPRLVPVVAALLVVVGPLEAQEPGEAPVTLHPGAIYARLSQDSFEPVNSVAGQEAFTRVPGPEDALEPAVLLSHRVSENGQVGVHATLGTGLSDPGDVLLLGMSVDLLRVFLTVGAATTLVEEGVSPLDDEVFRGEGDRTLYAELTRERTWAVFLGLSFGILP